ncbi:MAG: T9SS type A sorting domain-containing protein [Bacteroidota bacterium]|nr:T9SS type A sorting domain-containing protein [Bacteroidota bacterium]
MMYNFYNHLKIKLYSYQLSLENSPTTVANITQAVNVDKVYFDHIIIYPNPFADYLTLKNAEGTLQISIIDALGNVILKKKDYNEDVINTSDYKSGLYFLVISKNDQKKVFKLIKQ